jgi:hypothetical protein
MGEKYPDPEKFTHRVYSFSNGFSSVMTKTNPDERDKSFRRSFSCKKNRKMIYKALTHCNKKRPDIFARCK